MVVFVQTKKLVSCMNYINNMQKLDSHRVICLRGNTQANLKNFVLSLLNFSVFKKCCMKKSQTS